MSVFLDGEWLQRISLVSIRKKAARIKMLLFDVDGVLTDGGIVYADDGAELKRFHVRDGSGLKLWERAGNRAAIISGRSCRVSDWVAAVGRARW